MQFEKLEQTAAERRYDPETLSRVTSLAHRLQESHEKSLTAEQIEAIGEEVGLGRAFVREALKQLALDPPKGFDRGDSASRGRVASWAAVALWGLLICALSTAIPSAGALFAVVSAPLVAMGAGSLTGKRGAVGPSRQVSSPALLDMLVAVQRQVEERSQCRAFLSMEVAGTRELRRDTPQSVALETFARLREWIDELVTQCGGECRGTVEDGLVCTFPTGSEAVSAARQVQEGLGRFNMVRNRLKAPIRIRCGIAAGAVASEEQAGDALREAFIERAIELQQRAEPGDILVTADLAAAALLELRTLAPLPREAGAAPVFSWRAGQRSHQRP